MTIFLSLLNIIVFLCLDAFFVGLVIVLGFMQGWKGMLIYYVGITIFIVSMYLAFPCPWAVITIKTGTISFRIPFVAHCELDCARNVHYIYFQDQIETKNKTKNYIMLSLRDLKNLPPEKVSAWRFDFRTQIVMPYNKKTEPVLLQWLDGDHWVCDGGTRPDVNVPPPPLPKPPKPEYKKRPSKETVDEHNKGFRNYG